MSYPIEDIEHVDLSDAVDPSGEPIAPASPGDVLRHDFMAPLDMSANQLAAALHVPTNRITSVLNATRRISADTALRLARYSGVSADFWLGLQAAYDLAITEEKDGERIRSEIEPRAA